MEFSGSNVTFGGTTIGTFSGGTNGSDLVVSLNGSAATPAAVQALADHILYSNTSEAPSTSPRTVTFAVADGDGGTGTATATVNVTAQNDAPVVDLNGDAEGNNTTVTFIEPAQIQPSAAMLEGVQGYAGLGPNGDQFGGNFLRSPTGNVVTLHLDNLPAHSSLSLDFLFAAIDSLDGTGTFPSGDFFNVKVDGVSIFRKSFANALLSQTSELRAARGG